MTTPVATAVEGRTLLVTIDRPEVGNADDGPTAEAHRAIFAEFNMDDALDVAVLIGASGTFCAGAADLKAVADGRGNRVSSTPADQGPLGCTRTLLDKLVTAAVEAHAVAGGLELALWFDLRVAAHDPVFGVYCQRWEVPLIDGLTVRLPSFFGMTHALDMILTAQAVTGEEAARIGLTNRLTKSCAALADAMALAAVLQAFPQLCLRTDSGSVYEQDGLDLPNALANETRLRFEPIRAGVTQAGASRFAAGSGRHGERSP